MTASSSARRLTGGALRRCREDLGLTIDDAARFLECDRSKVSRIETGQRGIRPPELRLLLAGYGAGEATRSALAALVRPQGAQAWWRGYGTLPAMYRELLPLEAAAGEILSWEPHRVPDLLQTPGYARALAGALPADAEEDAAAMLADRQHAVLDERQTPVTVLVAESALRQPVAEPWTVREQVAALASMAESVAHVTVCVLPLSAVAQCAATAAVTVLRFGGVPGLAAAWLPGPQGGTVLDDPAGVAACTRAFGHLRSAALSPGASARRLRELASR